MYRQVRRENLYAPLESLAQGQGRHALAAGEEAVKKQNPLHHSQSNSFFQSHNTVTAPTTQKTKLVR